MTEFSLDKRQSKTYENQMKVDDIVLDKRSYKHSLTSKTLLIKNTVNITTCIIVNKCWQVPVVIS